MDPKIVVVGSANTDMVVKVQDIPHLGETVLGGEFISAQGGKGANQAVAAARLGAEVTFVARLGRDSFGIISANAYQAEGINTDFIIWDDDTPSGVALILVNRNGENIIAVASGANGKLTRADVIAAESVFQAADAVLLQLEIPLEPVQAAIELAHLYHARVILNPAPAYNLPASLLHSVDYLTPNEIELAKLTETSFSTSSGATAFAKQSGVRALIVTQGAKGARVIHDGNESLVPGFPVKAVDTVAAGDAFNGALAVALSRGDGLLDAVYYANAAGALTVTRAGAQPSLPTFLEVANFMQSENTMDLRIGKSK
jgi:ribokinase